jgi:putative membrane protein
MLVRSTLLSAALLLAVGCSRSNNAPTPDTDRLPSSPAPTAQNTAIPNSNPAAQPAPTTGPMDTAAANGANGASGTAALEILSDEQIAQLTDDANSAEIDQAKVAESKAKDQRVKKFAERMVKQHTDAKDKQAKLNQKTSSSDTSKKLEKDASHTLSALKSDNDASFDRDYIADQVKEHQEVVDMINKQMLPNVKGTELKAYLEEIKPTVEMHLKSAQELQKKLGETASNAPTE